MNRLPLTDMIGARTVHGTKERLCQQAHRLGHSNLSEYIRAVLEDLSLRDIEEVDSAYQAQPRKEGWSEFESCPLLNYVRTAVCQCCEHRGTEKTPASCGIPTPGRKDQAVDPIDVFVDELLAKGRET